MPVEDADEIVVTRIAVRSMYLGIEVAGACYILVFLPVCLFASLDQNLDFLRVLFLIDAPPHLEKMLRQFVLPNFSFRTDLPFLSAVATAYGVMCLLAGQLGFGLQRGESRFSRMLDMGISVNGLLIGYIITILVSEHILRVNNIEFYMYPTYILKFTYIYFLFVLVSLTKTVIPSKSRWKSRIQMLLDGLFGLFSSMIVILGFSESLVSILCGPIFLVASFVGMVFVDLIIVRPFASGMYLYVEMNSILTERGPEENFVDTMQRGLTVSWKEFVAAYKQPTEQTVSHVDKKVDESLGKYASVIENNTGVFQIYTGMFTSIFFVMVSWPWVLVGIYLYVR